MNPIAPGLISTEASRSVDPEDFMTPLVNALVLKCRVASSGGRADFCTDQTSSMTAESVNVDGGQMVWL